MQRTAELWLDQVASALHPHWPEGARKTYAPEQLPGMARDLQARVRELEAQLAGFAESLDATADHLARQSFAATALHLRGIADGLREIGSPQPATAARCQHGHESPPDCAHCLAFREPPAAEPALDRLANGTHERAAQALTREPPAGEPSRLGVMPCPACGSLCEKTTTGIVLPCTVCAGPIDYDTSEGS